MDTTTNTTQFTYTLPQALQQAAVAHIAIAALHNHPWARPAPAMQQRATQMTDIYGVDTVLRRYHTRPLPTT